MAPVVLLNLIAARLGLRKSGLPLDRQAPADEPSVDNQREILIGIAIVVVLISIGLAAWLVESDGPFGQFQP